MALSQGRPDQAATSFRTSLSFAPDNYSYQLLLAEALAAAGYTEEAINYFLNLWESQPGDGFINLQLARLTRQKGTPQQAIDYYRAAVFGNWQGDGIVRRRETRLELADYLIEQKDLPAARSELLIAANNAPANTKLEATFADRLQKTGDSTDALNYYQRAIEADPHNKTALVQAGHVAYTMGDYSTAHRLLTRALQENSGMAENANERSELTTLLETTGRLLTLSLSQDLSARDRATHLLTASAITKRRFNSCVASFGDPSALPSTLQSLASRWKASDGGTKRATLTLDVSGQDNMTQLIYDTEVQTAAVCGAPTDDDALLLLLANSSRAKDQ